MGSNETATATTGGPRVIDVFYEDGAPSGPNYLLFSDVDRLSDSLWDRSEVGWSPDRMRRFLVLPESSGSKTLGIMVETCGQLSTCPHRYPPMEALTHAV